jgi:hypothetical protein
LIWSLQGVPEKAAATVRQQGTRGEKVLLFYTVSSGYRWQFEPFWGLPCCHGCLAATQLVPSSPRMLQ